MDTITFHMQKGGTGKTTMCGNLAYELRAFGNVLMLDADPQANLTSWWYSEEIETDLVDVLRGRAAPADAVRQVRDQLWILPTVAIDGELAQYGERELPGQPFAFQSLIEGLQGHDFRFILFDTGPGLGTLQQSVIAASDTVIGVTVAEYFGYDGIETYTNELEKVRQNRRADFDASRLIVNRVNRSFNVHKAYGAKIAEDFGYRVFSVGQSMPFSEAVVYHRAVQEHDPGNRYTTALTEIATSIVQKDLFYAGTS